MNIVTTSTREGRRQILTASGVAPTTRLTAYACRYFLDLPEDVITYLAHRDALPSDPGTAPDGRPSQCVDLLNATRAWMVLGNTRVRGGSIAEQSKRIANRGSDSQVLIDRLGCFAVAVAFSRPHWAWTIAALPGFTAGDHRITYGIAMNKIRAYAAGLCPA